MLVCLGYGVFLRGSAEEPLWHSCSLQVMFSSYRKSMVISIFNGQPHRRDKKGNVSLSARGGAENFLRSLLPRGSTALWPWLWSLFCQRFLVLEGRDVMLTGCSPGCVWHSLETFKRWCPWASPHPLTAGRGCSALQRAPGARAGRREVPLHF